jgi:pentalenene oxygenase
MPEYGRLMTENVQAVIENWQDGQVIDVLAEMTQITASTIAATIFVDSLPKDALQQVLEDVNYGIGGIFKRMLTPPPLDRLPTPSNLRFRNAQRRLRATLAEVIAARRRDGTDRGDLLSALLATRDHEGDGLGLSDEEAINQVITFFFAGMDTTASSIASALALLAENPAIQDRVNAEVDTVLGGEPVTYDQLSQLELTGRVVTETLRLWSPGWLLTRTVAMDTDLGGYRLPAGTTVIISPHLIQRQARVFDQPDRFDPDRWLPERASSIPRHAYLAFGGGARKCIGEKFGFGEAVLALAVIASRWRLGVLPGHRLEAAKTAVMAPKNLRLRLQARPAINGQFTPEAPDRRTVSTT